MKKFLALLLSVAMTLGCMGTIVFADEAPALPTATVTPLLADGLTFALNFTADTPEDEQYEYYKDWYADFELTVNKDVTFNANDDADGYLSGQYDAWSENWVNVPFGPVTLAADEPLKIMATAAEMLGQSGLKLTCADVYGFVQDFDCGVYFNDEFLAENPDLEVNLALRIYNPLNESEFYEIGEEFDFSIAKAVARVSSTPIMTFAAGAATVGGTYFMSLEDAIDAIGTQEGDFTINILKDIEEDVVITQNPNQTITITGDETDKPVISGTIKINGRSKAYETAGVTIQNIVFDATNITEGDAVILAGWDNNSRYVNNLTVSNCDFVGTTDWNRTQVAAVRTKTGGSKNFNIIGCTAEGLHSFAQTKNVEDGFVVTDCVITDCSAGFNINSTESFTMTGTTITVDDYGVRSGENGTPDIELTFEDNTINAGENAIVLRSGTQNADVTITSGTYNGGEGQDAIAVLVDGADVEISGGSYSSDVTEYLAPGLIVAPDGNGFGVLTDDTVADSIEVVFEDVTDADAEGEKLYNINLVAPSKDIINRLNSGDLTFEFDPEVGKNVDFEIIDIANDDITVAPVDNSDVRYRFNFNTKTDVDNDTANTITIAQVKFEGYGKFSFKIDDTVDTNAVHTTKLSDNIVDTFVVGGKNAGKGELIINNDVADETVDDGVIRDEEIEIPTRELTINIKFPNTVVDQTADYQDMTVSIVGGTYSETVELGGATGANAEYTIEKVLPYNTPYTVTVKGAGYRTARYTVTLNDHKTLNFWNNVKDADKQVEVEAGVANSATTKNFLAGDIVKDNNINIYDLSAVVSYFNTATTTSAYDANAKYDLNRDGVIDSKDVAYVLVSWGE